mgnify:CR=1 FL=1
MENTKDFRMVAQTWLDGNYDEETKRQIVELRDSDPAGFEDAFYRNLEFGTGGLRGIMGVGTNRMNRYTVGMATQGLANYIGKHCTGNDIKVCISFDSRNNSKEFAQITANVLAANRNLAMLSAARERRQESWSLLRITRKSITVTRYSGQTEHRLHLRLTKIL